MAGSDEKQTQIRKKQILYRTITIVVLVVVAVVSTVLITSFIRRERRAQSEELSKERDIIDEKEAALLEKRAMMEEAEVLAAGYDYDAAIALLTKDRDYDTDTELVDAVARYTAARQTLQAVDCLHVPHLYFHSLINDTEKAFDAYAHSNTSVAKVNAWMTTVEEFDAMIETLYQKGYVLVRMRDLVMETTNEEGETIFVPNDNLKLPAGKRPYVLSVDDWSYYHEFEGMGFATRALISDDGIVKCEYYDKNRVRRVGDYDVVPRLESFLREHPDGAYHGARGIIALTGIEGVFGYRTDPAYAPGGSPGALQSEYLKDHPEFDYDAEVRNAKAIAEALKAEGWEFACHTYSHEDLWRLSYEENVADQETWQKIVGSIVGPVDTMAFTREGDIGDWHTYDENSNPLYAYYKGLGYQFYLTTDVSTPTWIQMEDDYLRQGRIDCSGYQMWRVIGDRAGFDVFEDLFDVYTVFSEERPTPVDIADPIH